MNGKSRWRSLRNRLALIALGLLLGLAARWLIPADARQSGAGLFVPMPASNAAAGATGQ